MFAHGQAVVNKEQQMLSTAYLIAALALTGPGSTPTKGSTSDTVAKAPHCEIRIIDEAQVPAREAGDLVSLDVREGARVQAGQPQGVLAEDDEIMEG